MGRSTSSIPQSPIHHALLPEAIFSVSRKEYQALALRVQERSDDNASPSIPADILNEKHWQPGTVPDDLWGHVFIAGAVGYSSESRPKNINPALGGWTSLLNGEGIIHRVDFHTTPELSGSNSLSEQLFKDERGKAWLTNSIVKTPDHYADQALGQLISDLEKHNDRETAHNAAEQDLDLDLVGYYNYSLFRLSLLLGIRNSLNTAFLPMVFPDGAERLVVTWDAGRPYELDPISLDLVAPIGWNSQWHAMVSLAPPEMMSPPVTSSAHPQFDTTTGEMFTVNVVKSLGTFLWVSRLVSFDLEGWFNRNLKFPFLGEMLTQILKLTLFLVFRFVSFLLAFLDIGGRNAVYLNRWLGSGTTMQQWQVIQANGQPLKIRQTMHQMGLTKHYLVLADTAFKIAAEDALPSFGRNNAIVKLLRKLRPWLSYPQVPYTDLYLVARDDLKPFVTKVKTKRVRIQPETAHFLTDYDDTGDKITLHVAHSAATDPAEFLHSGDRSVYDLHQDSSRSNAGMFASPMDVNRLGVWIIDAKQGCVEQHALTSEAVSRKHLWWIALYAWRGFQPKHLTTTYWNCWGCWPELLSQYILDMYRNYEERVVPLQELIDDIIKPGKPASLVCLKTEKSEDDQLPKLTIADHYDFPVGVFSSSPQFIPRKDSQNATDGYVVTVVLHGQTSELWIFDANHLNQGPRFRLCHPDLNLGLTLHTTWLPHLQSPPVRKDYDIRADYSYLVQRTGSPIIADLFEKNVYPNFPNQMSHHGQ